MKVAYYPGCTLKTKAQNFETSALAVSEKLGYELEEIDDWVCCGTVYSLADDDLMHHLAPIRNLIHAQDMGHDKVVTMCSMCYNTLARANNLAKNDSETLDTINMFLSQVGEKGNENPYRANTDVIHFLEFLHDNTTWENLAQEVEKKLNDLPLATYYGCTLTRPEDISIDENIEDPYIMERMVHALGGKSIETIYKTECCGSYNTVNLPDVVVERTYKIINTARKAGAEALILSCPLCEFNLDERQKETAEKYTSFEKMPVLYFTQILALTLGVPADKVGLDNHYVDPKPLLKKYKLLE